jgi:hypothetical protein
LPRRKEAGGVEKRRTRVDGGGRKGRSVARKGKEEAKEGERTELAEAARGGEDVEVRFCMRGG